MSELIAAAKAVIDGWDNYGGTTQAKIQLLRDAVERAEKQEAFEFDAWWESAGCGGYWDAHAAWTAAQQAERERIRARAKLAAEKVWKSGDWYIGPQHNMIERFVEELLRGDDE